MALPALSVEDQERFKAKIAAAQAEAIATKADILASRQPVNKETDEFAPILSGEELEKHNRDIAAKQPKPQPYRIINR